MSLLGASILIFTLAIGSNTDIQDINESEASTIDEVIDILQNIVNEAKRNNDQIGYFPTLYKMVTEEIKSGIENNEFENPSLMHTLDVNFANHYIRAYVLYKQGYISQVPKSWMLSFNHTTKTNPYPHVLEHLLTGMNAHINLDLGIAVAETSINYNNENIDNMRSDFIKINEILESVTAEVEHDLVTMSFPMKILFTLSGNIDEEITKFSMIKARDAAWEFAELLHDAYVSQNDIETINELKNTRDDQVAEIGHCITNSGVLTRTFLLLAGYIKEPDVTKNVEQLEERHVIDHLSSS